MHSFDLAKSAIIRGVILHGYFKNIDHPKFFLIIGEHEDDLCGLFFVNSNINFFTKKHPEFFEMQMLIRKSDYHFLDYDSFIDATKIRTLNKKSIATDICNQKTQIKGSLTENDLDMLLDAVRASKLFSKIEKDHFFG